MISDSTSITFEDFPKALKLLLERSERFDAFIASFDHRKAPDDQWFTLKQLSEYLPDKPALSTLYRYTQKNLIPFHKSKKRLRFLKSEVDAWLKEGKRQTKNEIEQKIDLELSIKK